MSISSTHAYLLILTRPPLLYPKVDPEDYSIELCTLSSSAQSFTKADGQMLRMMMPAPCSLVPGGEWETLK